ncbi:hypothetical protein FLW53_09655 [Microbispora sp. SCL1-1]|uniref:hypothetical protein n=1 Tax=unclassified Microbispora TaxID=2614687 RepID=UPI001158EF17|nr:MULTISPECIES: hypothetical protein [unclassified Microbispora]NJP24469.1 hypothetical protein [Microbispora sp. CL1-1]TQS14615.1 hypothetical protein FLW53_09655 [Microbispora sp. SCL1-1]
MPFKTFGSATLTASDVQTYLMDQCVIRCTSTSRPPSPSEGWHIYETDTGRRMVYTGGSWRPEGIYERLKVKPETTAISGWFTPVYDAHLRFDLEANSTYWLEGFLMFQQSGETPANNTQWTSLGWTFPDAAWKTRTCWNAPMGDPSGTSADTRVRLGTYAFPEAWKYSVGKRDIGISDSDPNNYINCGHNFCAWADATGAVCEPEAMIKTTTAGTLILTWSGGWGGASNFNLRLLANSWLRIRKAG